MWKGEAQLLTLGVSQHVDPCRLEQVTTSITISSLNYPTWSNLTWQRPWNLDANKPAWPCFGFCSHMAASIHRTMAQPVLVLGHSESYVETTNIHWVGWCWLVGSFCSKPYILPSTKLDFLQPFSILSILGNMSPPSPRDQNSTFLSPKTGCFVLFVGTAPPLPCPLRAPGAKIRKRWPTSAWAAAIGEIRWFGDRPQKRVNACETITAKVTVYKTTLVAAVRLFRMNVCHKPTKKKQIQPVWSSKLWAKNIKTR